MKIIDKIIKILIKFKYKRKPFVAWTLAIDDTHNFVILLEEYYKSESEDKK